MRSPKVPIFWDPVPVQGADPTVMDYAGFNAAWWAKVPAFSAIRHTKPKRSQEETPCTAGWFIVVLVDVIKCLIP